MRARSRNYLIYLIFSLLYFLFVNIRLLSEFVNLLLQFFFDLVFLEKDNAIVRYQT